MIKVRTIGMADRAVTNPVLTSTSAVANFDFITDDGETYLVANTITGDDAYMDNATFKAGEYLNGHNLKAWVGEQIVADEKHIAYANGADFDDIKVADPTASPAVAATIFTINGNGKLAVAQSAPQSGYYFVVAEKTRLTGNAVILTIKKA